MASPEKIYWDSCVWIALINEEAKRVDSCKHVIELAKNGKVEIWTSTLALAEVFKRKCEGEQKGIDPEADKFFEEFLKQDFITLVQVDSDVATAARRLLRKFEGLSKPQDAIHIATALIHNVDAMHTFDRSDLLKFNGKFKKLDGSELIVCVPPMPPLAAKSGTVQQIEMEAFIEQAKPRAAENGS